MVSIPSSASWYIAELVMECRVEGNPKNVVHVNIILIHADSSEQAFTKAEQLGKESEDTYPNPENQEVTFIYRGLRELLVIHDELEDGAELMFEEKIGIPEEELQNMLTPKSQLTLFRPPQPREASDPSYSSKEIMDEVEKIMRSSAEIDAPE